MKKLSAKESILVGSLLFGMLFGAGNVIFPIQVGQEAGANFLLASIGFFLTAVGLPILAVISFTLSRKKSLMEYAQPAGKPFAYFFSTVLLLTIGPFFATPRTATVAFEVAFANQMSGDLRLPLFIYSLIFFALVLYFALKPSKILDTVGRYMAPAFIVLISILMIANFRAPMGSPADFPPLDAYKGGRAFTQGLLMGYSTMDVLACQAFSMTIISNIQVLGVKGSRDIAKQTGRSSLTTLVIMGLLYFCFVYFGASSLGTIPLQENGGLAMAKASNHFFGKFGAALLAVTVTLACMKTAIGLAVAISGELNDIYPNTMSLRTWTILFVAVSFFIANFGLNTIISLSIPFLNLLYPLAIALTALWILNEAVPFQSAAFKLTTILTIIPAAFDFLKSTPAFLSEQAWVKSLMDFATAHLPLFDYGLAWLLPAIAGILLSLIFYREKKAVPSAVEEI